MKGIGDLMKQAQEMQSRMNALQDEMGALEVTGEAGAGLVKVTMNGRYETRRVEIDSSLMSEDKAVLEDLIAAACNGCVAKVGKAQADKMAEVTGGMNLPFGDFKL